MGMKKTIPHSKITYESAVFMAAVIEYMSAEVLELSGNAAIDFKKKRIIPRHIMLAIHNDEELSQLLPASTSTIHSAGVAEKKIPELLKQSRQTGKSMQQLSDNLMQEFR